jgi:O-antigen ligase
VSHVSVSQLPTAAETTAVDERAEAVIERVDPARLEHVKAAMPVASVVLACAWWLLLAPRLFGGRGAGAVTGGAVLTALATVLVAPHRYLPRRVIWLALAVSAGALTVAATAPTGWAGVGTAASYVAMSWTVVAVAAAVVRDRRVTGLLALVVVAGTLIEVAESWLAWWGGLDAATPIVGTFYWYNQFAVFLVAGTIIGLALWLQRTRLEAGFGLLACALGCIGIIYSTSRASGAVFVAAAVLVALTSLVSLRGRGLARLIVAAGVTAFSVWAIGGPPFFPHRALPFSGTAARASGQSLSQNGGYRVEFWRESVGVFERHPLVGGGYHSMITETIGHVPHSWVLSPFAHNGYLQALSDGGLVLGAPFLLGCAGILWLVLRSLARSVRRGDFSLGGFVVPLCLGALLAHSAVDFDWTYAADFAVAAVLAGLVLGERWSGSTDSDAASATSPQPRPNSRRATAAAVLAGVALCGVAAVAAHAGDMKERLPVAGSQHP